MKTRWPLYDAVAWDAVETLRFASMIRAFDIVQIE